MNDLSAFKAFAEHLAELARPIARHYFRSDAATLGQIDKPDATPVTLADMAIEQRLRDEIAAVYPSHGILGEEHESRNALLGKGLGDIPPFVLHRECHESTAGSHDDSRSASFTFRR